MLKAILVCTNDKLIKFIFQYLIKYFMSILTALLLAYMKGNGNLCRTLVKAGACVGAMNHDGITIFNCQMATSQLLSR